MTFNYEVTKKEFKRNFPGRSFYPLYLIFYTIIFFMITFEMFIYNPIITISIYFVCLLILGLFIYLFNSLYRFIFLKLNKKYVNCAYGIFKFDIDEVGIQETGKDFTFKLKWSEIKKVISNKKYIKIIPKKEKFALKFKRDHLTDKDAKQLEELIRKYQKED